VKLVPEGSHRYVAEAEDTNTYKYIQKIEENSLQYVQAVGYAPQSSRRRRYNGYAVTLRVTKPLGEVLQANPVLVAKADFTGKVGVVGTILTYRGIRAPKGKMYVAPVPEGYSAVAMLFNQASALSANKVPWSAVAYGYRLGRGRQLKAILLLPKSFEYVKEKRRGASGPFRADRVRIFFWQDLLPGFNVGETYQFHIEVLRPGL
jgi:hypothetical protein